MKKILVFFVLGLSVFALSACAEKEEEDTPAPEINEEENVSEDEGIKLTLEGLAEYDGKDGKDAYIAVDGNIYDVSDSGLWRNGSHNGYQAGQDLTDLILNESPHGLSTLGNVPLIGELID